MQCSSWPCSQIHHESTQNCPTPPCPQTDLVITVSATTNCTKNASTAIIYKERKWDPHPRNQMSGTARTRNPLSSPFLLFPNPFFSLPSSLFPSPAAGAFPLAAAISWLQQLLSLAANGGKQHIRDVGKAPRTHGSSGSNPRRQHAAAASSDNRSAAATAATQQRRRRAGSRLG